MADIKTHLRELTVATTVGLLKSGASTDVTQLYDSKEFFRLASAVVSNDISSAQNLLDYPVFTGELRDIVNNGFKLGVAIYKNPHFKITRSDLIYWLGNNTQKADPVDVQIGQYGFSLKEDSFILKNMGLYQLLNHLTGSNYARGLHVFRDFASNEYDAWFAYTWKLLIDTLTPNKVWHYGLAPKQAKIAIVGSFVELSYMGYVSRVPVGISTNAEFMDYTTSLTREKVFSRWINKGMGFDPTYTKLKKICAETAGAVVSGFINDHFAPAHVYDFLQILNHEYYYAKTTYAETTILRVPGKKDFNSVIQFLGCRYDVPFSQLNIITQFQNKNTGKILEFRNECRFSHGQFNGTPEAKMYVVYDTPLSELYEPI